MQGKTIAPNFTVVTPNSKQLDQQRAIAAAATTLANALIDTCPSGPDLDASLGYIRSAVWSANQSVVSTATRGAGG